MGEFYPINLLKIDWQPTDYYHADDLNRVDKLTYYVNERIYDYRRKRLDLDLPDNLVPYPSQKAEYMSWNTSAVLKDHTFKSGRTGFKAEITDFSASPYFRVANTTSGLAQTRIVKGKKYRYTVIFEPSPELESVDYASLYYYHDVATRFWQDFSQIYLINLPKESELDNTYRYEIEFTAEETAGVRASFGFGPTNNPNMNNGSYFNIVEFRIEEVRTKTSFVFADELTRLEKNLGVIREYLNRPSGTHEPKTNWNFNEPFSYIDSNRLEQNLYYSYHYFMQNATNVPYCGQHTISLERGVL